MTPKEFSEKWWGLIPDKELAEWEADIASIDDGWRDKIQARLKELSYSSEKGFNKIRIEELNKLL